MLHGVVLGATRSLLTILAHITAGVARTLTPNLPAPLSLHTLADRHAQNRDRLAPTLARCNVMPVLVLHVG